MTNFETVLRFTAGSHTVSVLFNNAFSDDAAHLQRTLSVDYVELDGPLARPGTPFFADLTRPCGHPIADESACARQVLAAFAPRALRRPVAEDELARLVALYDGARTDGDPFAQAMTQPLQALLTSPHFLFRVELDPDPQSTIPHPLSEYELASRLSYFLWSSMPDDDLFAAAAESRLHDQDELSRQVVRMLADPKAAAFVENFAGQWLWLRNLPSAQPDPTLFPSFDEPLRDAMRMETESFFRDLLGGGAGMDRLLTADWSFVNDRLAAHYGMDPVGSDQPQKVPLPDERRGLLGQGSLLTVTSHATRTSPTRRGKWVLEQLLCDAPPPPPNGVNRNLDDEGITTGTLRQRLEAHVKNPTCAACHTTIDPVGFGLEHFDAIGAWRDLDSGLPVDATGNLGTKTFDGAVEEGDVVAGDSRFPSCVAQQVATYALGRPMLYEDKGRLDQLTADFAATGYRLPELIRLVVTNEAFRMRRGEPAATGTMP
jgi:hypothetical protein